MWLAHRGRSVRFFTMWGAITALTLTLLVGCRLAASDAAGPAATGADATRTAPTTTPTKPGTPPSATTPIPTGSPKGWQRVYADDFNAPLNTATAWSVYDTPGSSNPGTSWYAPDHVLVGGGQLHINGYVDTAAQPDGRIVTGGLGLWKKPQKYGKWEMLVRMDACTDVKYAWLLWPFSNKWPADGEVDFAEDQGGNRALTTATLLYAAGNGTAAHLPQDLASPTPNFSAWHEIGLEWTKKSIRYTLDGKYWGKPKTTHLPPTPMVFVLQTESLALPSQVNLPGGYCNAQVGWVVQYKPA